MAARYEQHIKNGANGGGPPPPASLDRFAPKYLVGNVPAGDSAIAYAMGGFIYIPDPGDGSGIALALALGSGVGDVWIRPGTYDLGAGGIGAPIPIPASTRVQGSGQGDTTIIGRTTGDQGVFTMASGSSLRDLSIAVPSSDATSLGSDAVILVTSGDDVTFDHVNIVFATDPAGQLREGIRFGTNFTFQPTDLHDVHVIMTTSTGIGSPTIGFRLPFGQNLGSLVVGRYVQIFGGDISIESDTSVFVCDQFFAFNFSSFGVRHVGGQSIRLSNGILLANFGSVGAVCAKIGANDPVLEFMTFQNNGSAGSMCVWIADSTGGDINLGGMYGCTVLNAEYGVRLGDAAVTSTVSGFSVADTLVEGARRYGILVEGIAPNESNDCSLHNNRIEMFYDGVIVPVGIRVEGHRHELIGNILNVGANDAVAAKGIEVVAHHTELHSNTVFFAGLFGIHAFDERTVVDGCDVEAGAFPVGGACIRIEGVRSTITGGSYTAPFPYVGPAVVSDADQASLTGMTVFVLGGGGAAPGISLTGDNNTCVSNVVDGAGGTPVSDTGIGNDVANNIG